MVSLASRFRMLAIQCRYQYAAGQSQSWLVLVCYDGTDEVVWFALQSFERLNPRCVAVVVDPIQSVKGKVVIDAFRLINPHGISTSTLRYLRPSVPYISHWFGLSSAVMGQEPRQTTSNIGHLHKPSIQALIHGLNRHYYSIAINFRKTELEQIMLLNLHKQNWTDGLMLKDFEEHSKQNEESVKVRLRLLFFKINAATASRTDVSSVCLARKCLRSLRHIISLF